ncbi:MAG: cobaltochelatase subunit CobN, partial [Devosiaceae bacterium]|nr:cobaltochelatase subunit CobN [Devosiaceae bacterium MH13]
MHVLTAQAGRIEDGEEPVDLGQTPGDILVLSSADSELSALTLVAREERLESSFRLANLGQLKHPYSVDLYVSAMVDCAPPPKVIAIRLIGGQSYWPYGLDRLVAAARANAIQLIVVPGDAQWDPALADLSTTPGPVCRRYWQLLVEGGVANLRSALGLLDDLAEGKNADLEASAVKPFQRMGWCDPETLGATGAPQPGSVPIVFYASLMQAGTVAPIRALANALIAHGLRPAPLVVPSLKDEAAQAFLEKALPKVDPPVVINTTAFASSASGQTDGGPLSVTGAPVIQAVLSGASREAWDGSAQGLPATDLIMHVVMPELDGRIHGRAISFKQQGERDAGTQFAPVAYEPEPSGIAGVARLAKRWADLRVTPESQKTVAIVLAHYPSKRSRIGNGVGLDTPASVALFTQAMREAGYAVDDAPTSGAALMDDLLNGKPSEHLPLETYRTFFAGLAPSIQQAITARWGRPEDDPAFADGRFTLPLHRHGKLLIGIQPARGYGVDPEATYHDPDLVPPHAYLAFYAYLQTQAHAVIQFGKHGNLEWLPGKAMALSGGCYPAALLGEVPTLYPFIVNDPGEGCQAKRRTGAVIVDHLMPPLARAESYGPYQELETLLDEYTMAQASDPARARVLADDIVGFAREIGLTEDVALPGDVPGDLAALDTALCDLKELQIRDGLHVFGAAPDGQQTTETLVALARIPSGSAPDQQGLHRALASDLGLGIDPLARAFAQPWKGPKPDALARLSDTPWRSLGDGIERLEAFAQQLVAGEEPAPGPATEAALAHINT